MSGTKRPMMMIHERAARAAFASMSKAALADLCADLLRRCHGENDQLDGAELVVELRKAFEPVAIVRGDRMPGTPRLRRPCPVCKLVACAGHYGRELVGASDT